MRGEKYLGKLCEKHPQLTGLRYYSSKRCVDCALEKAQRDVEKLKKLGIRKGYRVSQLIRNQKKRMESW